MSKPTGVLELNKCISSRLWYTSLNVFRINNDGSFLKELYHKCSVDLTELEIIVESLIYSPNEEQYQWIAYILLCKLMDKSSNVDCNIRSNIQTQFDYIQMRNAIELCGNLPDYLYKELLVFLQNIRTEHSRKITSNIISQQIFTFLKKNIHIHSEIVCYILNILISAVSNTCNIASDLQDIYFSTLKSYLEHIPIRKNWYLSHEVFESVSPKADLAICNNSLRIVLCLLSEMDLDTNAEIEFLKIIYPFLLEAHHVKDIELALYSRKNGKLFSEWLLLWNKRYACSESATTLFTAYKISEYIFKLTENSKILLFQHELLERISTRKLHWLNDILDICYILTMKRKCREVELLLSYDLLKRLYPVLLFKALNDCSQEEINSLETCDNGIFICESITFFLEKCYSDLHSDYHLNELHMILENHIKIVEYILYWKKKYFIRTRLDTKELKNLRSDAIEQIVSVKQIFSLLQKYNILSVIKITTNIHDQDHSAIQNLLKASGQSETFQAYCCIVNALKAILSCEFYDTEYKQIAKYFTDMVSYLSLLPLSLKMETMRNIFSLLFLRYEDFTNVNSKDDCNTSLERTGISKSVENEKLGFVANKYAVRDMLHYLWKSTSIVIQEIDEVLKLHNEIHQLRENISIFTSTLSNARWRLKFYMGSHFIKSVGIPQDESDNSIVIYKSETVISQKPNFPHRIKEDTFFYKGDSTSDENKVKSDSGSESGLLGSNTKRKKRSRIVTAMANYVTTKDRPSLINLLLASKESLVLHCLWRCDLQKAWKVVEESARWIHCIILFDK